MPFFTRRSGVNLQRPRWPFTLNRDSQQADGLIAWYPFGYGAPRALNMVKSNFNYNMNPGSGGIPPVIPGPNGGYALNRGIFTSTIVPITAAPLTLMCWFNLFNLASSNSLIIISSGSFDSNPFQLGLNFAVNHAVNAGAAAAQADSTPTIVANTWSHACAVFDSTTSRSAFLNGSGKGTNTSSATPASLDRWKFGEDAGNGINFFGLSTDYRIYNRALTDTQVYEMYDPKTRWELYRKRTGRTYITGAPKAKSFLGGEADETMPPSYPV